MDGIATRIKLAIERLGVVSDVDAIYELATNSIGSEGVLDRMILRKQGDLLGSDILRAHGIRANIKIGSLFWDCLNERGRSDPVGVACTVSRIANSLAYSVNTIARISDAMGDDCQVEKIENNMLAGPCEAVRALPLRQASMSAPPFPLLDCTHPDQCACRYMSVFEF